MITLDTPADPVVDVVILAWKNPELLRECLSSLAAQSSAPAFGTIIVLNGAEEAVRREVHHNVSGARIVDLRDNIGFGLACNAGAAISSAHYLAFLNDDAVVEADWLAELIAATEEPGGSSEPDASNEGSESVCGGENDEVPSATNSADPPAGSPGPTADSPDPAADPPARATQASRPAGAWASVLLNGDTTVQEAGCRSREDGGSVRLGAGLTLAETEAEGLLSPHEIAYGSAAAFLIERELFSELGGFDPRYRPAYWEDVDLCLRLRGAGRSVWLAPRARVVHRGNASTGDIPYFLQYVVQRSNQIFFERWGEVIGQEIAGGLGSATDYGNSSVEGYNPVPADFSTPIALEIQRDYAAWLEQQLKESQQHGEQLASELWDTKVELARVGEAYAGAETAHNNAVAQRDQLQHTVGELGERIAALDVRAAEAERDAATVRNTLSWRVTSPLRAVTGRRRHDE